MKDQLSKIDQRILQLKQKKEKLQTQQAIAFLRESQKILGDKFSPDLAIHILSQCWISSSEQQKKEWEDSCYQGGQYSEYSFRNLSKRSRGKPSQTATENP